MWWGARLLVASLPLLTATTHAYTGETLSVVGAGGDAEDAEGGYRHHRARRQLFDGFRFSHDGILAMERLDELMRTTIPTMDRFQCVERLMCSVAAGQLTPPQPEQPAGQFPAFDPTFQQGAILNPSTIQQSFSGLVQNPAILQQGLQGLLQGQGLQSLVQNPALQQGLVQSLVQNPALQQGLAQSLSSFQNPAFQTQGFQGAQHGASPFRGGTNFQNSFQFRENPDAAARASSTDNKKPPVPQPPPVRPLRRRRPPLRRRPQRRGFFDFLGRLGRRKKRSVIDDMISGFTDASPRFMGLIDQMMTSYSFYPYTHAAYMGYSGSPERCQTMYPSCPSTAEQMLDFVNNIHKHYPNGIPYKESMPWPLNVLLP